jgi:hypothetical protein
MLYDQDLLDNQHILWTFPQFDLQIESVLKYLMVESTPKLEKFFKHCCDGATTILTPSVRDIELLHDSTSKINDNPDFYSFNLATGLIYLKDLYNKIGFDIVSDVFVYDHPVITEKTYRPILLNRPFIVMGAAKHLKFLESLGFRTFASYMAIPNYDDITNDKQRMQAVIDNIVEFPNVMKIYEQQIMQDLMHNHKLVCLQSNIAEQTIQSICEKFQLDFKNWKKEFRFYVCAPLIDSHDRQLLESTEHMKQEEKFISEFEKQQERYERFKGSDWPKINSVLDLFNVPKKIADEFERFDIKIPKAYS